LETVEKLELREVDNTGGSGFTNQTPAKTKAERDNGKVQACLEALTQSAASGQGNLLALA